MKYYQHPLLTDDLFANVSDKMKVHGNYFFWPESTEKITGFYSYYVPKEEQIRSAIASELWKKTPNIELEWNVYYSKGTKKEIDIAIFSEPSLFIEVKRVIHYESSPKEQLEERILPDIEKLKQVKTLNKEAVCFLFIVYFYSYKDDNILKLNDFLHIEKHYPEYHFDEISSLAGTIKTTDFGTQGYGFYWIKI